MKISESTKYPTDDIEKMDSNQEEEETVSKILSNAPGKEDIILKIFSFLPIKSILRFKCVSKEILSLTTNPLFISLHSAALRPITPFTGFFCTRAISEENSSWRSPPRFKDNGNFDYVPVGINSDRFLKHENTELPDPSLRFLKRDKSQDVCIYDSCNGLLLCRLEYGSSSAKIVCNPLTKEKVVLPFSQGNFDSSCHRLVAELTPMGYLSFNVVCAYQSKNPSYSKLRIFSSETGRWENIKDKLPVFSHHFMNIPKVYSNRTLVWDLFDRYILVLYFDKSKRKNGRLCELIETPGASLSRSLWDHNGKVLCYFHGCNKYDFHVQQLCFNESNQLKWKVEDSEEFKSLEEDICMGYWEYMGKERSLRTLPKSVPFKIMGYNHTSKTLIVCIPNAIFFFDMKKRRLQYFWGTLTSKFELFNYIDTYVHCFAPIQVSCLPKPNGSVIDTLKEDSISARNKAKSIKKANVLEALDPAEPEAIISNKPISDLNNVDDNPDSTRHNREFKETSNRYAALINAEEVESEVDDSDAVECVSETLSSEQLAEEEEEELSISTFISPQKVHKAECNAVDGGTNLVSHDCSELQTLANQSKKVEEAKATPSSTIPKNKGKGKGGKNRRRRNKEVDDKEYELIFKGDGNMPDEARLLKAY
ncbi:hypothetical protein FRX31_004617 [Thalictrum thalictroides]|uniref:F-box domain-containing protein n=1 Tax=Thalictrum thalictroides TaxID=46969 RepID=A0A7J6X844_THATH|nr:hypothetical protein FRX31_004617 [Thalictrum thalictroides]